MLFIHLIPQVEVIQRSAFCDEGSLFDAHPYLRESAPAPRFHPEAQRGTCFKRLYVLTDHAERKLPQRRNLKLPGGNFAPANPYFTSISSFSFPADSSSIFFVSACVNFSNSS